MVEIGRDEAVQILSKHAYGKKAVSDPEFREALRIAITCLLAQRKAMTGLWTVPVQTE